MTKKTTNQRYFVSVDGHVILEITRKEYDKNKNKHLKGLRYFKKDSIS